MKFIREIAVIFSFTLAGEFLNYVLPFPVPAGVYGLFLLLLALISGVIKLTDIEKTGSFLLDIMPLLFIPAGVGLLENFEQLKAIIIPLLVTVVVSTFFVMTVTGKVAQSIIRKGKNREE